MLRIYEFRATWQRGVKYPNLTNNGLICTKLVSAKSMILEKEREKFIEI